MDVEARLGAAGSRVPGLDLLVLLGSRATGTAHERSDWDVGYLGGEELDPLRLAAAVAEAVGSDDVDVVDLARASAVLRQDASTDGRLLHERVPGAFLDFRVEATTFWCDVEPVLREAHAAVLAAARART